MACAHFSDVSFVAGGKERGLCRLRSTSSVLTRLDGARALLMFNSSKTPQIETLISRTVRVNGDVDFAGGLHLDGTITGNVHGDPSRESSLSVSETGSIEGNVEATNVTLNGTVRGDILATGRVTLGAKARVQGNVRYGVIEMTLGAQIMGKVTRASAPVAVPERSASA
jgi:cytoskeletal protein CcmA (bactofilin family)